MSLLIKIWPFLLDHYLKLSTISSLGSISQLSHVFELEAVWPGDGKEAKQPHTQVLQNTKEIILQAKI